MKPNFIARRSLLEGFGAFGALTALESILPAYAWASASNIITQPLQISGDVINLTIAETPFRVDNRTATAVTINGTVPGPLIRLREGQKITLNVTNRLKESSWGRLRKRKIKHASAPGDRQGVKGESPI